jgi:DnaK suppressor protein
MASQRTNAILQMSASRQSDWRHRDELEHQLREIIDAQDRLMDGSYGRCSECGSEIGVKRLVANPAASLCVSCQASAEPQLTFHSI